VLGSITLSHFHSNLAPALSGGTTEVAAQARLGLAQALGVAGGVNTPLGRAARDAYGSALDLAVGVGAVIAAIAAIAAIAVCRARVSGTTARLGSPRLPRAHSRASPIRPIAEARGATRQPTSTSASAARSVNRSVSGRASSWIGT
jgi:hypothetical protein